MTTHLREQAELDPTLDLAMPPTAGSTSPNPAMNSVHERSNSESVINPASTLRRQVLRPRTIIPVAVAVAALLLAIRSLLGLSPAALWTQLQATNPFLLLLAVAVFYLTFPVRALRWRTLLHNTGHTHLPSLPRLTRMMLLGSFANSISVAQLGDVYRGYLLSEEASVPLPLTLGTIVAERLLDIVTLIGLLGAAALTVYAGRLPASAVDALCVGVAISIGGMLALLALPRSRFLVLKVLPARWLPAYDRFEQGAVRSLRRLPLLATYSAMAWVIEGATLWLLARATSVDLSAMGALVTGLVASLLSAEPVTPGGLGVTEPGIILILSSLGVAAASAGTIALLNRAVNYLSLAIPAALAWCLKSRRVSRFISGGPLGRWSEQAWNRFQSQPQSGEILSSKIEDQSVAMRHRGRVAVHSL
ncbi:MAG: flippase-like domain-containing protein [Chloroflexi bacterium]|nr:flippase-like domain-containing protein [Chloroflexota bacterium]